MKILRPGIGIRLSFNLVNVYTKLVNVYHTFTRTVAADNKMEMVLQVRPHWTRCVATPRVPQRNASGVNEPLVMVTVLYIITTVIIIIIIIIN